MAPDEVRHRSRRGYRDRPITRPAKQDPERNEIPSASAAHLNLEQPPDVEAVRLARLRYLETPPEEKRKNMKYIGETVVRTPITDQGFKRVKKSTTRQRQRAESESKPRTRRVREPAPDEPNDDEYVYVRPPRRDDEQDEQGRTVPKPTTDSPQRPKPRRKPSSRTVKAAEERRTPPRRHTEPARRRNSYSIDECSDTPEVAIPTLRKSASGLVDSPRPSLKRSTTIAKPTTEVSTARSTAGTEHVRKRPGLFKILTTPIPEKKVSCLTCGADDIPIKKSAKLECSHRMCHACLERIFTMSVNDPAHMPPRCCTSKHIPLEHVKSLFPYEFRKKWNRKFDEYTTRNRIYCPARGCGEWIKPGHISTENGRKVGKCKRCGTRVCGICSNKMHTSRECPKDPATQQFVEVAKEKGWQRCFSCSAMVELKEGCNHMTCRCTAEFCMVCGLKWKSCDCPWFNYDNVDAHLGNPARYQEEMDRRRDQEHRDEAIARRMEVLGMGDDDGVFGIGNAAGHHMNQNFIQQAREALTANYQHAEQAARGLLNGLVTGRENRLPGLPLPANQTAQVLRQDNQVVDPAEAQQPARRPTRQGTLRRHSGVTDMLNRRSQTVAERAQDRMVQDWANGITTRARDT